MISGKLGKVIRDVIATMRQPRFDPAWLGRVGPFQHHHPVFSAFIPFSGPVPVDFEVDYIGMRTRRDIMQIIPKTGCSVPAVDEDYFEWIDVLQSVRDARDKYTMIELGACYGPWAVRAALAARQLGIEHIKLGLAEAEPMHLIWLRQHLQDNGIRPDEVAIYDCAVSDENGSIDFYVGMPDDFGPDTSRSWHGQSIIKSHEKAIDSAIDPVQTYCGQPVVTYASGWKAITVNKKNIRDILSRFDDIDLIDLDVQEEELRILTASADLLDRQVKRLHIGTHGPELEEGLRKLLGRRGWFAVRDYGCHKVNPTPFGDVQFVDGVQSWINLRFDVSVA